MKMEDFFNFEPVLWLSKVKLLVFISKIICECQRCFKSIFKSLIWMPKVYIFFNRKLFFMNTWNRTDIVIKQDIKKEHVMGKISEFLFTSRSISFLKNGLYCVYNIKWTPHFYDFFVVFTKDHICIEMLSLNNLS